MALAVNPFFNNPSKRRGLRIALTLRITERGTEPNLVVIRSNKLSRFALNSPRLSPCIPLFRRQLRQTFSRRSQGLDKFCFGSPFFLHNSQQPVIALSRQLVIYARLQFLNSSSDFRHNCPVKLMVHLVDITFL